MNSISRNGVTLNPEFGFFNPKFSSRKFSTENPEKSIFYVVYNDTDFIIKSSYKEFYYIRDFYTKLISRPRTRVYTNLNARVRQILLNGGKFKLLLMCTLTRLARVRLMRNLKRYFNNIDKVKNCDEYQLPPIIEPNAHEIIGDVIIKDGIKYIEELNGNLITFQDAEKKYIKHAEV